MSNVLFVQVIPWITRWKRAVSTSHGRRGRPAGWLVCWGCWVSCSRGGAAATSNPTGVALNGYLLTNMVLLFCENKIRFSCVKIRTEVSCEATNISYELWSKFQLSIFQVWQRFKDQLIKGAGVAEVALQILSSLIKKFPPNIPLLPNHERFGPNILREFHQPIHVMCHESCVTCNLSLVSVKCHGPKN